MPFLGLHLGLHDDAQTACIRLNQIVLKEEILNANCLTFRILLRAEDGTQTRDPQLGRLMLYQLSYFRNFSGQRWIRTTEGVSQQIYSLPHLATLVFALLLSRTTLNLFLSSFVSQLRCKDTTIFVNSKQNRSFLLQ